ncbi:MAG: hypothetical protein KF736_02495 [Acidobacteria bacterium]|nr:hypothetical protein [Acidobacteriota bacterium]MCW5949278.1 hypothetical protein [Pyrinomonadaceae bacterium]
MRNSRIRFVILAAFAVLIGASSVFAGGDRNRDKRLKTEGILSVKTSPVAYPMRIDGNDEGMTGVGVGREIYLTPGFHTLEIIGPGGKIYKQEIEIRRGLKHCVCLKSIEEIITKNCPYRFHLEGPDRVVEGDMVTFAAVPDVASPIPVKYQWRVSPDWVRVVSGQGTPTITIDSAGLGGRTINAELDVNDDVYDNRCRQVISVPTDVDRKPERPTMIRCDEFESRSADDDKARLDNCVIQVQNIPNAMLYVIIYPGTDKASTTRNTYERLSKRALDYMVRNRGLDPRRIQIVRGSPRPRTTYELVIVPTGAEPPTFD